tara:strand:+ start:4078 stop:4341 length:264 start_codon:yes stop_codon:yes gene_type:complete
MLPSIQPAELATVIQELINAIESDRARIAELESIIAKRDYRNRRMLLRHDAERGADSGTGNVAQRFSTDGQSATDRENNIRDRLSNF